MFPKVRQRLGTRGIVIYGAALGGGRLCRQSFDVQGPRVHLHVSMRVSGPLFRRTVPIQFEAITIGVTKVDRFADAVVAGAPRLSQVFRPMWWW
jgi:hypothetical protein